MQFKKFGVALIGLVVAGSGSYGWGDTPLNVLNPSFEFPTTNTPSLPVSLSVDNWTLGEGTIGSVGSFPNSPSNQPDYLPNMDGNRAAYMLVLPGDSLSQPLVDGSSQPITYSPNLVYTVNVAVANSYYEPAVDSDALTIGLYYTDMSGQHTVAEQTYTASDFSSAQFNDFGATTLLPVGISDPAAVGQQIMVEFSTVGTDSSGVFDLDNVRVSVPEPASFAMIGLGAAGLLARRRPRTR